MKNDVNGLLFELSHLLANLPALSSLLYLMEKVMIDALEDTIVAINEKEFVSNIANQSFDLMMAFMKHYTTPKVIRSSLNPLSLVNNSTTHLKMHNLMS